MKVIEFCVTWNVVIKVVVLLVKSAGLNGEDELSRDDLSKNSKTFYDKLSDDGVKKSFLEMKAQDYKLQHEYSKLKVEIGNLEVKNCKLEAKNCKLEAKNCKLEAENRYAEFVCATTKLKSQTGEIYPDFTDQWLYRTKKTNPNHRKFMRYIYSEVNFSGSNEASRFKSIAEEKKLNPKFEPQRKIRNNFYHMFAMLTRYNSPVYGPCITDVSRQYARNIIDRIVPSGRMHESQPVIEDFSRRYAHIRECFIIFARYHNTEVIDKTVRELRKEEQTRQRMLLKEEEKRHTNASETNAPIEIDICRVLERMGVLQEWQFTQNDIYVMNNISLAIRPNDGPIYFSRPCDYMIDGEMIEVLIPFTDTSNCPVLTKKSSTTIIQ